MSLEQLQQGINEAAQAIDRRLARDAETIRELVGCCKHSLMVEELLMTRGDSLRNRDFINRLRAAIARAEGK